MSDYQLQKYREAPSQMGGAWGGFEPTNSEVPALRQTLPKATSLSNSIPFNTQWDQGYHYA